MEIKSLSTLDTTLLYFPRLFDFTIGRYQNIQLQQLVWK